MLQFLPRRMPFAHRGQNSGLWSTGAELAVVTPAKPSSWRRSISPPEEPAWDWDLVADPARLRAEGGEILYLFGQVLNFDGAPVPDVRLEIWQCGPDGQYRDPQSTEPAGAFRGYGASTTDSDGNYRFRTIRPVANEGRAPHINARLIPAQGRPLMTELYLVDAPENDNDLHYAALGPSRQAAVSIDPVRRTDGLLEAGFNFVL